MRVAAIPLLLAALPLAASADPFDGIVAAERAFAADAAARGARTAFVAAFADDALAYTAEGPKPGRAWYASRPEFAVAIAWGPEAAEVAASGDLGYTYGPAEYRSLAEPEAPHSWGHYFSIWERDPAGAFRVVHDVGVSHGEVAAARSAARRGPAAPSGKPPALSNRERNQRLQALIAADRARGDGGLAAVVLAADALAFRQGALPGPAAALSGQPPAAGHAATTLGSARLSTAGDLATTVGGTGPGAKPPGSYQRVWRWDGGRWLLALDLEIP